MAFGHGSAARLLANGYDLSPFMTDGGMPGSADAVDVSTWANADGSPRLDKAYIPALRDATFTGTAFLSGGVGTGPGYSEDAEGIWYAALAGDVLLAYLPQGGGFGLPAKSLMAVESGVELSAGMGGASTVALTAQSRLPVGHGITLHDYTIVESAGGNSIQYDPGVGPIYPTPNGGIGLLEVVGKGGGAGTLTVKVQHSTDGSSWVDLITFTGATVAHAKERIQVAGNVNRYLRSLWTATGGTWQFHVSFARFPTIV